MSIDSFYQDVSSGRGDDAGQRTSGAINRSTASDSVRLSRRQEMHSRFPTLQ
jgi:hypothetical protein